MTARALRQGRKSRLVFDRTRRLAIEWGPPAVQSPPRHPPRLGAAHLICTAWAKNEAGHIILGPECRSLPELDGLLREYERSLQSLRAKARRIYAAQASPWQKAQP
jgi:hypothetical protein